MGGKVTCHTPVGGWFSAARKALGLTNLQAEKLFYPSGEFLRRFSDSSVKGHWPEQFTKQYREALTPPERAKVLRRRVEHFIKTKGRE
jgi:hypothetical protein